ncbi:MAG TPA: sigma-70 family RNA polymerase sigma factor [Bacteroidia bacterium]|nr:sigma-70 family RNA polymerase sigma factor [Bacteroidia bacterium]
MKKLIKSLAEQSDLRLVKFVQHGNNRAFAALVMRHSPDLRGIVHGILHNYDDERDAVQEVWKIALPKLRKHIYRENGHFAEWLHTLAFRIAKRIKKKETHYVHYPVTDTYFPAAEALPGEEQDEQTNPLTLLKKLNRKMRLLVILHAIRGMRFRDISVLTGIKENVARVLYGRAIAYLRKEIVKMKSEK